jgi:hypothetical protein
MDNFLKKLQDSAFKIDLTHIPECDKKAILDNFKNLEQSKKQQKKLNDLLDEVVVEAICDYYQKKY